jgi:peptidoglycan DL-endopeptidase RipA
VGDLARDRRGGRTWAAVLAGVLAAGLVLTSAQPVNASGPGKSRQREAQARQLVGALQGQLVAAGSRVSAAAEAAGVQAGDYAAAMHKLAEARVEAEAAEERAVVAEAVVERQHDQVDGLVRAAYMSGGSVTALATVMAGRSPMEIFERASMLARVTEGQVDLLERFGRVQQRQAAASAAAAQAVAKVEGMSAGAEAKRRSALLAAVTQQEAMAALGRRLEKAAEKLPADVDTASGRVRSTALQVVAAEEALRRQVSATLEQALIEFGKAMPHATRQQARQAVNAARSQLGVPYSWGGGDEDGPTLGVAGPKKKQTTGLHTVGFDCSGLATYVWAQAGLHLDSYTGYQWVEGRRVALDRLRPGDLVFFAKDVTDAATIHHVGIYTGNGWMINAPHTGAVVRYDTIYRPGLIGAVRP